MDEHLKQPLGAMEARLSAKLDRAAEVFASEMEILHTELRAIDERFRRDADLKEAFIELLTKQMQLHQKSDNTTVDLHARHTEFTPERDEPPATSNGSVG